MEISEETLAEKSIKKLPYAGHIKLTFIRVNPSIKIINKNIPLQYLSKNYKEVYGELEASGIDLTLKVFNLRMQDYYKFICRIFPDFDVQDCQSSKVGKPDFFLLNKETQFYIEVKNGNDGIRNTQMTWVAENPEKEVWFLFIGGIEIDDGYRRQMKFDNP